jgi:lipopolysaccharide biosynthesis regulator YciM
MLLRTITPSLVLIVASGCSGSPSAEDVLEQGRVAAAKGNYAAAMVHYKNALQTDIDSLLARYELGALYAQLGSASESQRFLIPVVTAGFETQNAVPLLASAYFQQDKFIALDTLLNEQVALSPNPELTLQLGLFRVL